MDLILWRHAEAVDAAGASDLERRLTGRGEKQAQRVAHWLHARLPESARLLVSPAVRARQTAAALEALTGRKARVIDSIAPGASVDAVLAAAEWPHARHPVVIIGHQPTLGGVAARLLADTGQDWSVRKGAAWWLHARERDGRLETVLRAVVTPDLV